MVMYNRPNDRKAPRFRRPVRNMLNQEFYRRLKKEHPGLNLSISEIRKIIFTFHDLCNEAAATNRDGLELMSGLGYVIVGACTTGSDAVAGGLPNWETNRRMCKIYYTNVPSKYKFKFANLWGFAPGRQLKKSVSQSFKINYALFYRTDFIVRVSRLFMKKDRLEGKLNRIRARIEREANQTTEE